MLKWIAIGVVILAVAFGVWYFVAGGGPAQRNKRSQCDSLKAALTAAQARNDANAIAQLQLQIAQCDKELAGLGDKNADPIGTQLSNCQASFDLINPQLSDIIATDRSDWLKRGNIWRNALHFATDGVTCLSTVAAQTEDKDGLARLRTIVRDIGVRMRATQNRLYASSHGGESGLDAYSGSPEPGGDDKAHAWLVSVTDPLWSLLKTIDTKLSALDASNPGLTAELSALSASASPPANGVFGP